MSSFDLFSQMFNDNWQWIFPGLVSALVSLVIVAIATFFLRKDEDFNEDLEDDDESVDLEILMTMMEPGVLSVKCQVNTIELVREANQFEQNNHPYGSDKTDEMTGTEKNAKDSSEQENHPNAFEEEVSVEMPSMEFFVSAEEEVKENVLLEEPIESNDSPEKEARQKKEMLESPKNHPTNFSIGNKSPSQLPNKKKSFLSTLKGLCCCCWTKKNNSKATHLRRIKPSKTNSIESIQ